MKRRLRRQAGMPFRFGPRAIRSAFPRRGGTALALAGLAACGVGGAQSGREQEAEQGGLGVAPSAVTTIPTRARRELRESSGVVVSLSQPGVLFMINDSGNEPILFAMDTTGADRGAWRIMGSRNVDWEAAALGPCASPSRSRAAQQHCIYIGDVGDNDAARRTRTIYQVGEPRASASGTTDTLRAERLEFRYEDGPHDVEAMYVGADGTTWLLTKRRLRGPGGAARPALVFAIRRDGWSHPTSVATASLVDSLPIIPGSAPGRLLTDASRSPDGWHVAVRTYTQVYVFSADSATGRIRTGAPPATCDITSLEERQGEAIAWMRSGGPLLLTSEGRNSPLRVVSCPLPDRRAG